MSVQASLNFSGLVNGVKTGSDTSASTKNAESGQGNQLFSGILGAIIGGEAKSRAQQGGQFTGPPLPDSELTAFLSEANLSELEGKLLPLLPGAFSGQGLAEQALALNGENAALGSIQALFGSNTLLEQLRGLLTGVDLADDAEALIELRGRITSLLDAQLINAKASAESISGSVAISDQAQSNARQEINAGLNNIRSVLNEFLDKFDKTRGGDFFDLDQSFFDNVQKKSANFENLLAVLNKSNLAAETGQNTAAANTVLGQIAGLLSGNAAITQPLLNSVVDSSSLQPSNPTQTQISAPLNSPQWSEELGQRIRWLVGQNLNAAQIRLNPAELGPVELRINVSGDQVNVAFTSQFGAVRESIEAALPKLREMLENQGLNLANADINHGDNTAERHDKGEGTGNSALSIETLAEESRQHNAERADPVTELVSSGLVDQFV